MEVLQGDCERLSKKTLQFLKAEIGSATAPKRGARPKAGAVPNSRAADERTDVVPHSLVPERVADLPLAAAWQDVRQARSEIQHGHDHPCWVYSVLTCIGVIAVFASIMQALTGRWEKRGTTSQT